MSTRDSSNPRLALSAEAIVAALRMPAFIVNRHGSVQLINDLGATWFGRSREAITNQSLLHLLPEMFSDAANEAFETSVKQRPRRRTPVVDAQGVRVEVEIVFSELPLSDEPLFLAVVGNASDTIVAATSSSERSHAHGSGFERFTSQSQEEAQRLLSFTLNALVARVAVLSPTGKIIAVNDAWCKFAELAGVRDTDFVGLDYMDHCRALHGSSWGDPPRIVAGLTSVVSGDSDHFHYEYPCVKSTKECWFSLRATAFREAQPRRIVVAHTDITPRKLAEQRIVRRFEAQRVILELSTKFIDVPRERGEVAIHEALAVIASALNADRAYWFQFDIHDLVLERVFGYSAPHLAEHENFPLNTWRSYVQKKEPLTSTHSSFAQGLLERLQPNQPWFIASLDQLDAETDLRRALESMGVRSMLCAPVTRGRKVIGFVALDTVHQQRVWVAEDAVFLQSIPEIFVTATSRWRSEELLHSIVDGVASSTGPHFFLDLVKQIRLGLDIDYALVAETISSKEARILALVGPDGHIEADKLILADSPAAEIVSNGDACAYRKEVLARFPRDPLLARLNAAAYVGVPLFDPKDRVIGFVAIMNRRLLGATKLVMDVLRVFATRAASEIDLRNQHDAMHELNRALEKRVAERAAVVARQAAAMDATTEGMAILEKDRYVYMNDAHAHMFGYASGRDLLGWRWHDLFMPEEARRIEQVAFPTLQRTRSFRGEFVGTRRDGSSFDVHLSFGIAEQGDLICCCEDITERKRIQRELSAHRDELRQANLELARAAQLKDEFLASMSHELRTPLNAVIGMSEIMLQQIVGTLNEKQKSCLQVVDESGKHLLALINDILDLSKIAAGTFELEWSTLDVRALCEACIRLVQPAAEAKGHLINIKIGPNTGHIRADKRRLQQMIVNLLDNAVKFTPKNGNVGLEVTHDAQNDAISFVIWDDGVGIAPEKQHLLFRPFSQLENGLAREHDGAGLGLSLVKSMVQLHQGSISLESRVAKGTRVTLTLPRCQPNQPKSSAMNARVSTVAPQRAPSFSRSILVVDDNASNLAVLREFLTAKQYDVYTASCATDALDLTELIPFAAILMDIQMPGLDGLEAIRILRQNPKTSAIPVVAVTALAMAGDRERILAAGACEYVSKPIRPRSIAELLERLLAQ